MGKDRGRLPNGAGEGRGGAIDVSLETIYNGSKSCKACGAVMNPVQSLQSQDHCPTCSRRKAHNLVKGRMSNDR